LPEFITKFRLVEKIVQIEGGLETYLLVQQKLSPHQFSERHQRMLFAMRRDLWKKPVSTLSQLLKKAEGTVRMLDELGA